MLLTAPPLVILRRRPERWLPVLREGCVRWVVSQVSGESAETGLTTHPTHLTHAPLPRRTARLRREGQGHRCPGGGAEGAALGLAVGEAGVQVVVGRYRPLVDEPRPVVILGPQQEGNPAAVGFGRGAHLAPLVEGVERLAGGVGVAAERWELRPAAVRPLQGQEL